MFPPILLFFYVCSSVLQNSERISIWKFFHYTFDYFFVHSSRIFIFDSRINYFHGTNGEYSWTTSYTIDLRKLIQFTIIQFQLDDTESRWNDRCWEVNVADEDDIVVGNLVSQVIVGFVSMFPYSRHPWLVILIVLENKEVCLLNGRDEGWYLEWKPRDRLLNKGRGLRTLSHIPKVLFKDRTRLTKQPSRVSLEFQGRIAWKHGGTRCWNTWLFQIHERHGIFLVSLNLFLDHIKSPFAYLFFTLSSLNINRRIKCIKNKRRKLDARNLISISSNNKIIFNQLWHLFVAIIVTYFLTIISNHYYRFER